MPETPLTDTLLGEDPMAILKAIEDALSAGAPPHRIGQRVAHAAALRLARFAASNESGDWFAPQHTFNYANAVHQVLRRGEEPLVVRHLFDDEEIQLLKRAAKEDRQLDDNSFGKDDGEGGTVRLSLWNHPGQGIYGTFARCERLVGTVEQILRDEPYHYHSKMIMKDAKIGGAWTWHQDYGYWYQNGVLTANLCSASIAVDPATRENGCLPLVKCNLSAWVVCRAHSETGAGSDETHSATLLSSRGCFSASRGGRLARGLRSLGEGIGPHHSRHLWRAAYPGRERGGGGLRLRLRFGRGSRLGDREALPESAVRGGEVFRRALCER